MELEKKYLDSMGAGESGAMQVAAILFAAERAKAGVTNTVGYQAAKLYGRGYGLDKIVKETGFTKETVRSALADVVNTVIKR